MILSVLLREINTSFSWIICGHSPGGEKRMSVGSMYSRMVRGSQRFVMGEMVVSRLYVDGC